MTEWYMGLDPLMRIFWGCAAFSSVIFLVQTVMSFIGMDHDAGADLGADMDGDTLSAGGVMSMFTVRGFVNLLLAFGWTGICFRGSIQSDGMLMAVSLLAGVCFVFLCAFIMKSLFRLSHDGTISAEDVVGCVASVYLRIPEGGAGKIQVSLNGSVREYQAVASGFVPTGARVKVVEVVDSETFRVETI